MDGLLKNFTIQLFYNSLNFTIMRNILPFFLVFTSFYAFSQCSNFNNSITFVSMGACNDALNPPSAQLCVDFNITFTNGNASFYWGYIITENGTSTTTTNGPINSNQENNFPNIVCVSVPCGASLSLIHI